MWALNVLCEMLPVLCAPHFFKLVGCRLDLGCELVDIAKVWDNVEKGAESGRVVCVCVCVYT